MHAARANSMYMKATASARVTGLSSLEVVESIITAKLEVVEERRH
jgi:hypothetical protein